jgi:hypothetical protein
LRGAPGTDFDLLLEVRGSNGTWSYVTRSYGVRYDETLSFTASATGTYRWVVVGYSGTGAFEVWYQRP